MVIAYRGNRMGQPIRRRWILVLGLIALATPCSGVQFAGGTGEPNDPYLITTAEQFLAADFNVPGTHFRLCRDIDLGRKGLGAGSFRAHLDGAGFEIRNAVITFQRGLVDVVEAEATITNLTLANFDLGLTAWPGYPGFSGPVGGLASINHGTISNCGAIGWIATSRIATVGGLVGQNSGTMANCWFDGWVGASWKVEYFEDEEISPRVGGLVGYNGGSIANSLARGFVVGDTGLGGLVGCNNGTIGNCYATCMVIGAAGAGGLVSGNWGSLRNCYARGRVMGQMRGGLVGMMDQYAGRAVNCLWDIQATNCLRSGAGIGFTSVRNWMDLALNGWAGDPNWVMLKDWGSLDSFPRLAWEGAAGETVAEYPWPLFREGSGTRTDPYVIRKADDLERLFKASIYWDKHFVLANDLNDVGMLLDFSPIGVCSGSSFSGSFDGNGHAIRRLWVDAGTSEGEATAWNLGLFGYVTGEVRNLVLENCHFAGGANSCRVGTLVGTSEGVIENCSATGSIIVGEKSRFIGGLIGFDIGQINHCDATVTIKAGEGSTYIGDLVGVSHPPR